VRVSLIVTIATATALGGYGVSRAPQHLNPMIDLHVAKKPMFGLYAPANPRPRGGSGGAGAAAAGPASAMPTAAVPAPKSPAQLAADAMAYRQADFVFDGSMEYDFDQGYRAFGEFVKGMADVGTVQQGTVARLRLPIAVKTPEIAPDTALARQRIARQLDLGVSTIVFVGVESAAEVRTGLAAMRFTSKGGSRPERVGMAPARWGMSERAYREKADLWPLNPQGELTSWAIVETKAGLQHVREIAAVKGLAVLFPGAGTLRGVFSTVDSATKERKLDTAAWEASIQQVLAACKEFDVPCGYPANDPQTVEERMKQGFSVFIAGWGDSGFKAVEHGRKASGR
jgi:4-hydroxy-2-oxoheptanedioate aldolase